MDARDPIVSPEARGRDGASDLAQDSAADTADRDGVGAEIPDATPLDPNGRAADTIDTVSRAAAASAAAAAPTARASGISTPRLAALIGALLVVLLLAAAFFASQELKRLHINDWKDRLDNLSLVLAEHTAQSVSSAYIVLDSIVEDINDASIRDAQSLCAQMGMPAI